ncbi:ribonuclease H protein, partial [Trifolium medium]|nr:ribonuclease H protein [Trifolium medium]
MGFKNLQAFNLAMLANVGHNPSYVWRSIWSSKSVIQGGYKWSIGTGENIDIWDQNWLMEGLSIPKPTDLPTFDNISKVKDLIMSTSKTWDLDKIHGTQNSLGTAGSWQLIWRMKTPPKVKNLLWRICRNVLPTRSRLISRGINFPMHCAVCNDAAEDSLHVLFLCPRSVHCWQQASLWDQVNAGLNINNNITDNIFSILNRLDKAQQELFSVMAWSIWKRRNNQVWENVTDTAQT